MATYTFRNKKTKKKKDYVIPMSEYDSFVEQNPDLERVYDKAPSIGDPVRLGLKKPSDSFRDILRETKKRHPGGGGINTF